MKHQAQFNIRYSEFKIQYLLNHIRLLYSLLQKVVISSEVEGKGCRGGLNNPFV